MHPHTNTHPHVQIEIMLCLFECAGALTHIWEGGELREVSKFADREEKDSLCNAFVANAAGRGARSFFVLFDGIVSAGG